MKRLFIAIHIKPSEEFLDAIQLLQEQMVRERVKWVEEENLHLTLKFIGEVPEEMVGKIKNQLSVVPEMGEISFSIEGIGIIKNLADPRAIYANINNGSAIEMLSHEIDKRLADIGILPETKKFLPHLTLGRIKILNDKELLRDILSDFKNSYFQKEVCREFILFESVLTQKGPIYKKVSGYPL
jgi:RNA 2',3'-cyclic 3'-phosphodiesterase